MLVSFEYRMKQSFVALSAVHNDSATAYNVFNG